MASPGLRLAVLCALVGVSISEDTALLEDMSKRANTFGTDLFKTVAKGNSDKNVLVSPISAELALAETYLGAGGNTATQMRSILHLNDNREDVLNGHKQLIQALQKPVLKVANKLYVEKTFEIEKKFQDDASNYFMSTVDQVSFKTEPESARQSINSWVEKQTNDKIKNLLAEGSIDQDTRLVVVNALHFKDNWKKKFESHDTYKQPFFLTSTQTKNVDMMHITERFNYRYIPDKGIKILELPYTDADFRMVFVLPDAKDGLDGLIERLGTDLNIAEESNNLETTRVAVSIPKFKIEAEMNMNDILKTMGMKDLFDPSNANLTGITEKVDLYVSKVVQKVFIDVNEQGTEAAASTGMGFRPGMFPSMGDFGPEHFIADHPYLLALFRKNILLFIGGIKNLN